MREDDLGGNEESEEHLVTDTGLDVVICCDP